MIEKSVTLIASDSIFKKYLREAFENLDLSLNVIASNSDNDHLVSNYAIINDSSIFKTKAVKSKIYLVNMDSAAEMDISVSKILITYGIGMKNTVTISSLEENNFVYCIQNYLNQNNNDIIEPQEFPINIEIYNETHLYALMTAITIALIEGITGKEIEKKLSKKYLSI